MEAEKSDDGVDRVKRLFGFVKAFTNSRHPICRLLRDQPAANLQISLDELPTESNCDVPRCPSPH